MENPKLSAGEFKATCLKLMDEVARTGREIVVTKRGRPVAKLVPYRTARTSIAGALADSMEILGDIEAPLPVVWERPGKWDDLRVQEAAAPSEKPAAVSMRRSGRRRT